MFKVSTLTGLEKVVEVLLPAQRLDYAVDSVTIVLITTLATVLFVCLPSS